VGGGQPAFQGQVFRGGCRLGAEPVAEAQGKAPAGGTRGPDVQVDVPRRVGIGVEAFLPVFPAVMSGMGGIGMDAWNHGEPGGG
jgi:hypothetical protein